MKQPSKRSRFYGILLTLVILTGNNLTTGASPGPNFPPTLEPSIIRTAVEDGAVVARVYFSSQAELETLARILDIWEVQRDQGYLLALLTPEQPAKLTRSGFRVEKEAAKTALLHTPLQRLPDQASGIPGFPCYRTVEETYAALSELAAMNPGLAAWIDIGDSWEKDSGGGQPGYDLDALVLTNQSIPGPKPRFFLLAEIHARELATAETAARFAEHLVEQYGSDPDITWLLDYYVVHIIPMANPDGRKLAEQGDYWRKNTDSDDGCFYASSWGTDLNRNHSFHWNQGGSSHYACDETYHGPTAASEPEVQAIQTYVSSLFPDQRGPGDEDPAPAETTGLFISLHSYGELVLWPYGFRTKAAPNHTQLQTLGRKFAYFNGYTPQQAYDLYPTSGTSDDWVYGELGVAAYTFEIGTSFFQGCASFESRIYPDNLKALLYAAKAARRPYQNPAGPDVLDVHLSPAAVLAGDPAALIAIGDDTRYRSAEPTQRIAAARYSLDTPSWMPGAVTYPLAAADGNFDTKNEVLQATINTSELVPGRYTVFVEAQDAAGNWGPPSATFLEIQAAYQAELAPGAVAETGVPGSVVNYTFQVTNKGIGTDTFLVKLIGNAWPASVQPTIGPLASQASAGLAVQVSIPVTATSQTQDIALLELVSSIAGEGSPPVATAQLTTTAQRPFDLVVSTSQARQLGYPGKTIVYSLTLTNTGSSVDIFDISVGGSIWMATAAPSSTSLDPGESATILVSVQVPSAAEPGESDTALITVISRGDSSRQAQVVLTSQVWWGMFLALIYE